ncbi:choice-of-anchor P family protein [Aeromicrobium sp.]|uniref:choice-of-anchor P family protein n=1 Tax=Aeromicrobium sp. TaxID=1871063 RepID=UPI0019C35EFE|nr:choice-of-anchor P family protein [Aeromicrobium sp.]MBC7633883.1 hypothetical protein [Aeromicrobium sp.]
MRRALPATVALVVASAVMLPAAASTSAPSAGQAVTATVATNQVKTPFTMSASAYGTRARGAAIPAGSSETGYEVIGCNRYVPRAKSNFIASVDVPGLGTVSGARTRVWTVKKGNKTSSISRHTIAGIELVDSPQGSLRIGAVESESETFNRGGPSGTYGAKVTNSLAKIVFTPPGGAPQTLDLPSPGAPITVPGLAVISIGKKVTSRGVDFATAMGVGIRIRVIPTDTRVVIGQTRSSLMLARTRALFNGYGAGLEAHIAGETAQIGRTAYQPIPCIGTDGKDVVKSLASADLSPLVTTGDLAGGVNARKTTSGAIARAAGMVANVSLGDGALDVTAVTGVSEVRRTKSGSLTRSAKGTHVGAITANGKSYNLDALGRLEIPGVARLHGNIKKRLRNGFKVIGLRVTLLDGSLAVIDLGVAVTKIRPTKRK